MRGDGETGTEADSADTTTFWHQMLKEECKDEGAEGGESKV